MQFVKEKLSEKKKWMQKKSTPLWFAIKKQKQLHIKKVQEQKKVMIDQIFFLLKKLFQTPKKQ